MHDQRFLIDVAIVLGVAFPVLVLGRFLRIPELISYLLAGIAIGPHALRLIRDAAQVEAIAEVGVALILFFIGLHVPLQKLRTLGKTTFVSGSLQMAFTVAAVATVGMLLGLEWRLATFCGLLVALGSTSVVMPVLATREEIGAPYAGRFLGVSIFQDFAVIPLMLLVPAFASGRNAPPVTTVATRVLLAVVGVVLLVLVARIVVPRLFTRIAVLGRETFTAGAIVLIVATIAIAGRLGISAALGAFAAGIVVGDTEFIHEVAGILRPFRDFLSVLFFASIGMLLQPRFLFENLLLVLGTMLVVVAIKVAAAYPAFRLGSALPRTSLRAAFAVAPIGEFSFLLALEARKHGIMSVHNEQLFISVAVLTLAATPLLVVVGNRWAERLRGGQTDVEEDPAQQKPSAQQIILIGYGLNGQNITRVLLETSVPHVVIEEDPRRAEIARRTGCRVIVADAADPDALNAAGIRHSLAVVVAISDAEGTRRIVQRCRRMNPEVRIVVRTRYISEVETLRALGANEVIPEEFETSLEIVTRLLRILSVPGNIVAAQLRILRDEGYRMLRDPALRAAEGRRLSAVLTAGTSQTFLVMPDSKAEGRTLAELAVADDHVAVPAMLRDGKPVSPAPMNEPLQGGDTLFLVGAHEDLLRVLDRME